MLLLPEKDKTIACIDEAGRGPLCFEVVAAAVIMPSEYDPDDKIASMIKDSKKITSAKKRNMIADYIKQKSVAYGVGVATVEEIDAHNILQATYIAMHRALDKVSEQVHLDGIMVDGDKFKPYMCKQQGTWIPYSCVVDGDDTHLGIAAASILAKTTRDNMVDDIIVKYPELDERYGFAKNKGYGTAKHMAALKQYGATQYHRKSFAPVKRALDDFH